MPAIALTLLLSQISNTMILINYCLQKDYISRTLCENRDKPQMNCCGKCVVKKELDKDNCASRKHFPKEKETAKMIPPSGNLKTLVPNFPPIPTEQRAQLLPAHSEIAVPPPRT